MFVQVLLFERLIPSISFVINPSILCTIRSVGGLCLLDQAIFQNSGSMKEYKGGVKRGIIFSWRILCPGADHDSCKNIQIYVEPESNPQEPVSNMFLIEAGQVLLRVFEGEGQRGKGIQQNVINCILLMPRTKLLLPYLFFRMTNISPCTIT